MNVDPQDGLPVSDAGPWAADKHRLLGDYVRATWGARRKFKRCSYVDLFSGPGRTRIEETGAIADGSPLVAWRAGVDTPWPFSDLYLSDADPAFCTALKERMKARDAPAKVGCWPAAEAARRAGDSLNSKGLHLAFVDPYNLGALPFEVFRGLAWHDHIDFIVHFSAADLTRNLERYFAEDDSVLDAFAPGWREHVERRDPVQMRGRFFEYWLSLFKGFQVADAVPLFTNSKNAPLYRLVLLSRHPLAKKIWNSVADGDQRSLF